MKWNMLNKRKDKSWRDYMDQFTWIWMDFHLIAIHYLEYLKQNKIQFVMMSWISQKIKIKKKTWLNPKKWSMFQSILSEALKMIKCSKHQRSNIIKVWMIMNTIRMFFLRMNKYTTSQLHIFHKTYKWLKIVNFQ